mmetsp:Transcript_65276/g.173084  ORF Transcript_65276/g.173084 Transcript_65276/m.173084 type:complete len:278 (-) Transcript_65276:166-999(-)
MPASVHARDKGKGKGPVVPWTKAVDRGARGIAKDAGTQDAKTKAVVLKSPEAKMDELRRRALSQFGLREEKKEGGISIAQLAAMGSNSDEPSLSKLGADPKKPQLTAKHDTGKPQKLPQVGTVTSVATMALREERFAKTEPAPGALAKSAGKRSSVSGLGLGKTVVEMKEVNLVEDDPVTPGRASETVDCPSEHAHTGTSRLRRALDNCKEPPRKKPRLALGEVTAWDAEVTRLRQWLVEHCPALPPIHQSHNKIPDKDYDQKLTFLKEYLNAQTVA